jgi:3-phosphoinositide dependent protein kinase-1
LQDAESLYMGLEHCPNGELYEQLQARGPLPLCDAVQYAAEVVDILAYLRYVYALWRVVKHGLCTGAPAAATAEVW